MSPESILAVKEASSSSRRNSRRRETQERVSEVGGEVDLWRRSGVLSLTSFMEVCSKEEAGNSQEVETEGLG